MALDFLDILMEAKSNKKPIKISPTDDEKTDYTEEEPEDGATDEEEPDEGEEEATEDDEEEVEPADYTESDDEETEDEATDEEETDEEGGDEDPTDYTESEEEMGDDEEPTDYTDSEDDPTDYTDDGGSEEPADDAGDEEAPEMEEEGPTDDEKKNKALLEDLIRLKEIVGNFIDKTSSINGNDISNVKIINQLTNNLGQLSKQIHNYIIYRFSTETYVRNLYFYNYSIEALNISINMLKKINSFKHNK